MQQLNMEKLVGLCVHEHENLGLHTTFRIGGEARYFAEPETSADIVAVCQAAEESGLPVFILGNGSNILFSDEGFPGVVVSMRRFHGDSLTVEGDFITCSAGIMGPWLARYACEQGISGFEFLSWIPGSIGGLVMQNASCCVGKQTGSISDIIQGMSVYDFSEKKIVSLTQKDLTFGYRSCEGVNGVILFVTLKGKKGKKKNIAEYMRQAEAMRKDCQDWENPSAGCVFKNPPGFSAGALIDECGLKRFTIGGAQVAVKHANFIIKIGKATAMDVKAVIDHVQDTVYKEKGIMLERELQYVG